MIRTRTPKDGARLRNSLPIRNPDVIEETEGDTLTLRGPAAIKGLLGKLLTRASREPILKRYELEEVGAHVWGLIDGRRTFDTISKSLQSKYKMNRLEADTSLSAFLQMLCERGLITFLVPEG